MTWFVIIFVTGIISVLDTGDRWGWFKFRWLLDIACGCLMMLAYLTYTPMDENPVDDFVWMCISYELGRQFGGKIKYKI